MSAKEAIGRPASETILPPESFLSAEEGRTNLELQPDGRWEGEYIVRRQDGSTFPAHVRSRLISDLEGHVTGAANVAIDISARKESERALVSARNYLRAVTDGMGEGLFTLDSDGCASYVNQVALDLLGWPWDELQGRELHPILHHLRPDGSAMPIEECPMFHARRDGKLVRVDEDIFICHDGSRLPVACTASPFATVDGIEGCVVLFEDITERQAKANRVERDLRKVGVARVNRPGFDGDSTETGTDPGVHQSGGSPHVDPRWSDASTEPIQGEVVSSARCASGWSRLCCFARGSSRYSLNRGR